MASSQSQIWFTGVMRLFGTLLVLLFALQPQLAYRSLPVPATCDSTCIGLPIQVHSIGAATSARDGACWSSEITLSVRHRQRRNLARRLARLWRLVKGQRKNRRRHRTKPTRPTNLPDHQAGVGELAVNAGAMAAPDTAAEEGQSPKRGRPATIHTDHMCCVVKDCRGYGKFGGHPDHRIVGAGRYLTRHNGWQQMYRCQWCGQRFSETQGTVFFGLKTPAETVYRALTALAEGVSIRSTARIFGERPETILLWLRRAGQHSQQVSDHLLRNLNVSQAQLDELWTFVHKKEKTLSAWEQLHTEYGDTWIWVAFDPVNKLVLALLVGEREEEQAVSVLSQLKARLLAGCLPLFTSDQLPHYLKALLQVFARWVQPERQGSRGRFPNPRPEVPAALQYATVTKQKERGRVVSVTTQVVFGSLAAITQRLQAALPGTKINTSFVERMNLTLRHLVSRLRRKGLTFSKKREYLVWHLQLATAYYHFVRPHGALRQRLPEPVPTRGSPQLWQRRTPTMAASLTDHPWSMKELLSFRVPPAAAA